MPTMRRYDCVAVMNHSNSTGEPESFQLDMIVKKYLATLLLVLGLSSIGFSAESVEQPNYLSPSSVDLVHILAPPPPVDSAAGKADLQAVWEAQRTRTPAEVASAQADAQISVFRFAEVIGPGFKPEKLPFTSKFFDRISADSKQVIIAAKAYFNRPRPFVTDPKVQPIVKEPANASYPSGHATFAYTDGIILANMLPEKASAIFERAQVYAHNRVVGGVHYPTDVEAGRISGSIIDNVMLHNGDFKHDYKKACAEVRYALRLQERPVCDSLH
jgi:acid phosphatase (class A)